MKGTTIRELRRRQEKIIKAAEKEIAEIQALCSHTNITRAEYGVSTWVDDNGDDYVKKPSVCNDCKKILIPAGKRR